MNANIITSRVTRLSAIGLVLLSAFSFAGRTEAQPSTTPPQVTTEAGISPAQTKTSQDLGMNLEWQPAFAGIKHPITLPLGGYAFKLGFDYTYGERTRNDVKFTSDRYVPYLEGQFGLGHNLQFDASIPWNIDTMTRKDSTGQDSTTRDGVGNLLLGLQQNVFGNDGRPYGLSFMINGMVPTASYGRNNFLGGQRRAITITMTIPASVTGIVAMINMGWEFPGNSAPICVADCRRRSTVVSWAFIPTAAAITVLTTGSALRRPLVRDSPSKPLTTPASRPPETPIL